MNIGEAVQALQSGKRVARAGWNGKGMWLVLIPGATHFVESTLFVTGDAVAMKTAQGILQPGWLCSQNDLLSEDWTIVED